MPLLPWWKKNPQRLEWEYACLAHEGYKYEEISREEVNGTLEIRVEFPVDGKPLNLQVIFPPFFPEARFEIRCGDLDLSHHQNPFTKELCLLGRSTGLWDPAFSLASFLRDQMPKILIAGATEDTSLADPLEEHQAEPAAAFLPFLSESELLISESANTGDQASGFFRAKIAVGLLGEQISVNGIIRSLDGVTLWPPDVESALCAGMGCGQQIAGRWFKLSAVPTGLDASQFVLTIQTEHPEVAKIKAEYQFEFKHNRCELLAFEFPSEVEHRKLGTEWVLVLRFTPEYGSKRTRVTQYGFVRLERFGRTVISQRAPELKALAGKTVAVIGIGCVGAPTSIELARSGIGELRVLDPDIVEAGTVVRWPLGVAAIGSLKIRKVWQYVAQNFPFTRIKLFGSRIGTVAASGGLTLEQMTEFLNGVDLVLDAAAEVGVSRILSRVAGELRIPLVSIWSTNGGWGGAVVTYEPGKSGCYDCFLHYAWEGAIVLPPESKASTVQPAGCAEPTYLAANFDTGEISLAGVRSAVSILCRGIEAGYPELPLGVVVLKLREDDGRPIYPTWMRYDLPIHPKCERAH